MQRNTANDRVQVATASREGIPSVRTVILRGVTGDGHPFFVTDSRSRKADHLEDNPNIALVAWFSGSREQFRLTGRATLHGANAQAPWAQVRQQIWEALDEGERAPYLGPPPGRSFVYRTPHAIPASPPHELVVVSIEVTEADWLRLGPPHVRIRFRLLGPAWIQEELVP